MTLDLNKHLRAIMIAAGSTPCPITDSEECKTIIAALSAAMIEAGELVKEASAKEADNWRMVGEPMLEAIRALDVPTILKGKP